MFCVSRTKLLQLLFSDSGNKLMAIVGPEFALWCAPDCCWSKLLASCDDWFDGWSWDWGCFKTNQMIKHIIKRIINYWIGKLGILMQTCCVDDVCVCCWSSGTCCDFGWTVRLATGGEWVEWRAEVAGDDGRDNTTQRNFIITAAERLVNSKNRFLPCCGFLVGLWYDADLADGVGDLRLWLRVLL